MIVVDASYAMALVMPDEARPASADQLVAGRVVAPAIWPLEVANALRNCVRRQRLSPGEVGDVCAELDNWSIEVASPLSASPLRHFESAQTFGLTPYDAQYLDLALQRRYALATLDDNLAQAAARAGVSVLS